MGGEKSKTGHRRDVPAIYYLAVAGDVAGTFTQWRQGLAERGSASIAYSAQFFDACETLGYRGLVSFPWPAVRAVSDARFDVRSRPLRRARAGLAFHVQRLAVGLTVLADLIRERPRYAILMDGICYWFVLAPARLFGVRMIVSVHTVFWPPSGRPSTTRRALLALEGWFIRRHTMGFVAISREIVDQAREIAGNGVEPARVFLPWYDRSSFDRIAPPKAPGPSVRLLYIGRIEVIKGVLDLLDMVVALQAALPGQVTIRILGDGGAYPLLKQRISALGLEAAVAAPGACDREAVIAALEDTQIVIVPTRSNFPEGYAKSAVESIIACRPLVTSRVCPAIGDLRDAVEEAQPDDVPSYVDAILRLCREPGLYARRTAAAAAIRERYFDEKESWRGSIEALVAPAG